MGKPNSLYTVPTQQAVPESVEEDAATNPIRVSEGQQNQKQLSALEEVEFEYKLKMLGPSHHHALACMTCKVLHPVDNLKSHWKSHHPRVPLGDHVIGVLKEAGACGQDIPLLRKKVPVVEELDKPKNGWWCLECWKASGEKSTLRHSKEHRNCSGKEITSSLVQQINRSRLHWPVFHRYRRGESAGSEVSDEQVEDEIQKSMSLIAAAKIGDRVVITDPRNTSQFLNDTHWPNIINGKCVRPIINLVALPKILDNKTKDRIGEYPALSTFVHSYVTSLVSDLHNVPRLLRHWLATTNG